MVRIGLQIKSTLENIDELKTSHPDFCFFIKIKCTNCGEESEKWHEVIESEKFQESSRNPDGINFYMKCKLCSRENTIDILPNSNRAYSAEDSEKFKTIVEFDCRGVEPTQFTPGTTGWSVKSADNGPKFDNVDMSEDDWVEYDTKNQRTVAVYEFTSQFVKLK